MSAIEDLIAGRRTGSTLQGGSTPGLRLVEARVRTVTAAGVTFISHEFDGGRNLYGPAPYTQGITPGPQAGNWVLVAFLGTGIDRPWIVAWWPGELDR